VVSSSSTRRAARLAQKGKGKRVRFQGGTLFPLIVMGILVLGLGTIVYARQSQPALDATPPTTNDHWHAAYGFTLCDQPEFVELTGAKEEVDASGQFTSTAFLATGVHSHNDSVIHWHPYGSRAVGKRAKLGVFLDVYGIELDDESLRFPDDQGGKEYVEGETTCNGEPGELKVVVWDSAADTGAGTTYVSNFGDIPFASDGLIFSISYQPQGFEVSMPPAAPNLERLGAVDTGDPEPDGSVPTEGSVPTDDSTVTTVATDSTGSSGITATPTTAEASAATTTPTTAEASAPTTAAPTTAAPSTTS